MLREIRLDEIENYRIDEVLIIKNDVLWTLDELAEEQGLRFLVDFAEEEPEDEEETEEADETDEEEPMDPGNGAPKEEPSPAARRGRRTKAEIEELIAAAQAAGCSSVAEVMEHTGLNRKTVKRYFEKE